MRKHIPIRIALIVGLVVLWLWMRKAHPDAVKPWWLGGWGFTDERVFRWAWVAAVVLALYVIAYSWILMTTRQRGGPDAMGAGCGRLVLGVLVLGGVLLAVGMIFHVKFLVVVIGGTTLFTAVPVVGGLIVEWWKAASKRREAARDRM